MNLEKLEHERMLAAEQSVIASIPKELRTWLDEANADFAAQGGCPGCGSKRIAVHNLPCSVAENDLY